MQGLSTASFDVEDDGRVDARLVFARTEPVFGSQVKLQDLMGFVAEGVEVAADGTACLGTFQRAGPTEGDGLAIEASYACPHGANEVEVTLYYLSALGPSHREVARISAGSATSEAVLSGDHRAIALRLPGDPLLAKRVRKARLLTIVTAVFAAFLAALFVWRWRATRKA